MNYSFEKKAIKRLVDHYVKKMEESNKIPDERITRGFNNYIEAVRKAEEQDQIRNAYIAKAEKHMNRFIAHVRQYIGMYFIFIFLGR